MPLYRVSIGSIVIFATPSVLLNGINKYPGFSPWTSVFLSIIVMNWLSAFLEKGKVRTYIVESNRYSLVGNISFKSVNSTEK